VVRHPINLGQGAGLQTGITKALTLGATHVITFDADGQHDPNDIPKLLEALDTSSADVALGSRFKGTVTGLSSKRRLVLQAARLVNYIFTGLLLSDAHNGLRALSRHAASHIHIREAGMAHATEIISQIAAANLKYIEVPVTIRYTEYSLAKGQKLSNSINIVIDLVMKRLQK
jgi:glycosyltransferase involved in cell wall biosynthesis